MPRHESSGDYLDEEIRKLLDDSRTDYERTARLEILDIAQQFSPEVLVSRGAGYLKVAEVLQNQHEAVMPPETTDILTSLENMVSLEEDFHRQLALGNNIQALDISNKFVGYLSVHKGVKAISYPQVISQHTKLALLSSETQSYRSKSAYEEARKMQRAEDNEGEARMLREAVHWGVLVGSFGEEGKKLFDPMAISSVRNWLESRSK